MVSRWGCTYLRRNRDRASSKLKILEAFVWASVQREYDRATEYSTVMYNMFEKKVAHGRQLVLAELNDQILKRFIILGNVSLHISKTPFQKGSKFAALVKT